MKTFSDLQFSFNPESPLPKYQQIADYLAAYLLRKKIADGTKLPNDRELAELIGTAVMTLSRALNVLVGRGLLERKVGAGTFLRNYQDSKASLRRIAVVCHQPISTDSGFVSSLLAELSRQAGERGVDLLQLQRAPEEYPEMIQNFHLDGIIVLSAPAEFLPQLASYVEKGMNLVQVGVWHHDYCSFSFGTDHRLAAQQAVRYLLKKGRRNIGYIAGRQTNGEVHISNLMRIEGYQRGMWKARIPFNPDWILTDFITAPTLEQQLRQLIHNREMPDAFLLGNLPMAPRLYHILQNLHLRIPEDIALVTFDDALLCQQMTPALTAVNQNIPELVHRVFEKLLGTKMQEANHTNHGVKPIPTSFSERESC